MSEHAGAPAEIERALSSPDPEERRRAVSQLASLEPAPAVPLVLRALGDEDWRVRKEATMAARGFLPSRPLLVALVAALRSADVGLCNAAVDVLGAAGAAATPHLAAALGELGPDGRKLAVEALGRTRDRAALAPLQRTLSDPDPNVRQTAAESLAALSSVAPETVERVLLELLGDGDPIVRVSALSGLDALGAHVPWERLAPLLDDATLRPLALAAVARAGHAGAPAVLARALGASSGRTFDAALSALALVPLDSLPEVVLAELRPPPPGVLDRLVRAASAGDGEHAERTRTAMLVGASLGDHRMIAVALAALGVSSLADAAQAALLRLGSPATAALIAQLDEGAGGDDDQATLCVEALARIGQEDLPQRASVLPALRRAARGSGQRAAARALYALGAIGDAEDLALADAIFLTSEGVIAYAAEAALVALACRRPEAARALAAAAEGAATSARTAAVTLGALAAAHALGDAEERALRFLSMAVTSEDAATRRAATAALARVGGPVAIESLMLALADEEQEVRRTAARGLGWLAAAEGEARLLNVARGAGDQELLAIAVRAAGDLLAARPEPTATPPLGTTMLRELPPSYRPPPPSDDLSAALAGLCEDPSADVAIAALDALRRAATMPGRLEAMARALDHSDVDVVKAAVLKLAGTFADDGDGPISVSVTRMLPSGVWERLRRCLHHDLAELREITAEAICIIDPARGRDALVERAKSERDPDVLAAIDLALSAAQRQKKGAGPP